jgi:hypothetical protein
LDSNEEEQTPSHHSNPQSKRWKFQHDEAQHAIMRDYLGDHALFVDRNFELMFWVKNWSLDQNMDDR